MLKMTNTRKLSFSCIRTRVNTKAEFSKVTVEALKISLAQRSLKKLNIFQRGWLKTDRIFEMWEQMITRSSQNIRNQPWHIWPLFMMRGLDLLTDQNAFD